MKISYTYIYYPARYIVLSAKRGAISCKPIGNPLENPAGKDIPGSPAKLTGIV